MIYSDNLTTKMLGVIGLRKLLSIENKAPI
jgi:hypothetical protein